MIYSTIGEAIDAAACMRSGVEIYIMAKADDAAGMQFWLDSSVLRSGKNGGVIVASVRNGIAKKVDQSMSGAAKHPAWNL